MYNKDKSELISCPAGITGKFTIPNGVKSIGDYAFFSTATKIEKITIHHNSEAELKLGKDWIPNQSDKINKKIPVEYVGE